MNQATRIKEKMDRMPALKAKRSSGLPQRNRTLFDESVIARA
jgi:hypothetical protein